MIKLSLPPLERACAALLLLSLAWTIACNQIMDSLGSDEKDTGQNAGSVTVKLTNNPEAKENTASIAFMVQLSEAAKDTVKVDFQTHSKSAAAGEDFIDTTGTLVFPPDTTERNIFISLVDDEVAEADEIFTLELLSAQNATIDVQSNRKTGTILDDDDPNNKEIYVALTNEPESAESQGSLSFEIQLSEASMDTVKVKFSTEENAAKAGEDFIDTTGTVVFSPEQTLSAISVRLIDDSQSEPDEKFTLKLISAEGATIDVHANRKTGTILDDDNPNYKEDSAAMTNESEGAERKDPYPSTGNFRKPHPIL